MTLDDEKANSNLLHKTDIQLAMQTFKYFNYKIGSTIRNFGYYPQYNLVVTSFFFKDLVKVSTFTFCVMKLKFILKSVKYVS